MQRVGPAGPSSRRPSPNPANAGSAQPPWLQQRGTEEASQSNGVGGNSTSVPAAGQQASLIKPFAMPDAGTLGPEVGSPAAEAMAASLGLGGSATLAAMAGDVESPAVGQSPAASDEPAAFASSEASGLGCRFSPLSLQRSVPASSSTLPGAEFPVPVAPSFAFTQGASPLAFSPTTAASNGGPSFDVFEDAKALSPTLAKGFQSSGQNGSALLQEKSPIGSSFPNNTAGGSRVFEHAEEREHEALRILRQVESEVRTLKRWYTEAIEAMRSPNPFPAVAEAGYPEPRQA